MTMTLEKAFQIIGLSENLSQQETYNIVGKRLKSAARKVQKASQENKEEEKKKYNEIFEASIKIKESGYQCESCEKCRKIFPPAMAVELFMGPGNLSKKFCSVECRASMLES